MKTKAFLVVLAVVVAGIAFSVRANRQNNETNTAVAALARQRAAVRASIAELEQQLRTAKDGLARMGQATVTAPGEHGTIGAAAANVGSDAPSKPKTSAARFSPETVIANDPQKMAAYAKNFRATLDLTYGGMFKALHLSPEQIEKFKDLKVWLEQRRMDLLAAVETQGLDQQGDAYARLLQQQRKVTREKETELFGPGPLLEQSREYSRTQYLRDTTQKLASSLVAPDGPITNAQVERVTEIVASNSERRPGEPWSWQYWTTINWDAAGAQLQGVLSPSQLATLRLVMRQMEAWTPIAKRNIELNAEALKISGQPGN